MCRASDAMMDELEAQRQAYVQQEHYQYNRGVDSGIQMPTSTPYRPRNQCHSDTVFPSSSPEWFHRGKPITFIQTTEINSIPISSSDNDRDFRRNPSFRMPVKRYGNWRSDWKNVGRGIDCRHTLDECPEQEQEQALVVEEVKVLNGIRLLPPARRVPRGDDFTATTFPSSIPGIF